MSQQNYKIFVNDHVLHITESSAISTPKDGIEYISADNLKDTMELLERSTGSKPLYYVLVCDNPDEVYKRLKKQYRIVKAAGGVVFNKRKQLLLIKRLGLWDLPKGKMESGEDTRLTALREVHEECGIPFLGIVRKAGYTYHTYTAKGRKNLKKTTWYYMIAWDDTASPQTEEDITEVRWVDESFIREPGFETYSSIRDLLQHVKF